MKKFVFELEQLLNLRKNEQDQAQIELGKAVQVEQQIQAALDALARQYAAAKKAASGQTDFAAIAQAQQFYRYIKQEEERLFKEMAQAKLVTDEKRAAFNAAIVALLTAFPCEKKKLPRRAVAFLPWPLTTMSRFP